LHTLSHSCTITQREAHGQSGQGCSRRTPCQPGWRQNDGKCYFFSTDTKSWFDANNYCMEQNSHLTQIGTEIYWMGLNDEIVEGVWEWSDGSPFIEYLLWGQGQPDNWQGNEHCGEVVGYNNATQTGAMVNPQRKMSHTQK
uniref:C-type lectin domain-containing protein n=1 Tax=Oryzias melastigma TaxID=30732 RepID=A0A3B3BI40_ORYME